MDILSHMLRKGIEIALNKAISYENQNLSHLCRKILKFYFILFYFIFFEVGEDLFNNSNHKGKIDTLDFNKINYFCLPKDITNSEKARHIREHT